MKTFSAVIGAVLGFASLGSAHMQMSDPPPFKSSHNKFATTKDTDMSSPLAANGANFPCKGYHKAVGTPEGQPVATWTPGQSYKMTIGGGAYHNGGSCQASLSVDGGKTWKVIHSYIGSCPAQGESSFGFVVPGDTPAGNAIFAWTWFNQVGNREMYMNCAAVTIGGGAPKVRKARGASVPFNSRPAMFVANIGNGCKTADSADVIFPDPGPDVDSKSQKSAAPVGNCGAQRSGSGSASASAPAASGAGAAPLKDNNAGGAGAPPAGAPPAGGPPAAAIPAATSAPAPVGGGGSNGTCGGQ
ncbi:RNA polymerase Rpb1 repeat domain protein [Metarhizium album ARSEF 1941]|uniref:RNA polymerase Rpb1 repeat domain protein n=1 Tax=Metarhizium album (strain ARSEF 1941) TaxID=1081103 RepID=A0A0B2WPB4_METAS|nr:RNA polymerase Rpb1 repeat domain protein [Metarhizium album ARSEF 1941]KHN95853.1 RNA polymerase Rpb1 repeat domain protein [Metarhizium album ARSEF 1941]